MRSGVNNLYFFFQLLPRTSVYTPPSIHCFRDLLSRNNCSTQKLKTNCYRAIGAWCGEWKYREIITCGGETFRLYSSNNINKQERGEKESWKFVAIIEDICYNYILILQAAVKEVEEAVAGAAKKVCRGIFLSQPKRKSCGRKVFWLFSTKLFLLLSRGISVDVCFLCKTLGLIFTVGVVHELCHEWGFGIVFQICLNALAFIR